MNIQQTSLDVLIEQALQLHQCGQEAQAERVYAHILASDANPAHIALFTARHMLGIIRFGQKRYADALDLIGTALKARPDNADVLVIYGFVFRALGRCDDALAQFDKAVALNPNLAGGWSGRGSVLQSLGQLDDARTSLERALSLKPDVPDTLCRLGENLCEGGRIAEGLALLARHAALVYGKAKLGAPPASPHKIRHDEEQRRYLEGLYGAETAGDFRLSGGARLLDGAINPAITGARWTEGQPKILVIDNLLREEALAELRQFCWSSTIWQRSYNEGYAGAMPEHGFACPLLGQIAEELRAALPAILADHPLCYLWALKYDRHEGTQIHADAAAVNINFWITPDEANLDPDSGGMIVWDVAAPTGWKFAKYNGDAAASHALIEKAGAQPVVIPYRANRAVIFDSDLFHQTDAINFKDGYLNRRINVTFLYGRRRAE